MIPIIKIKLALQMIEKNPGLDDDELRDFFKTNDSNLEFARPNLEEVVLMFEQFKAEKIQNERIANILDY